METGWPEPRAARSIRDEPGSAANRQAFASPSYLAFPQGLYNPHIRQIGFRVSKNRRRAPPFRFGEMRACFSHRIVNDHPHCPDILSLRQKCPSLASVSGKWSLLDGMSAIATGSFRRNQSHQYFSSRPFSPVSHAPALLLDPLLPGPLQRRGLVHARAARALGRAGWIAGCSRQGFLDPERETSLDDVLTPLELPTRRVQAEMGTCRAAEVIDLSVNGVRVTLMPHELSELSGAAVDAARRAGSSTSHPAGVNRL